jgi:hypothetical protein
MPTTTPTGPVIPSLCYICIADNIPQDARGTHLHVLCDVCQRPYCDKHASFLDATCCQACKNDFQVTRQDYVIAGVEVSHKLDPLTGEVVRDAHGDAVMERRPYRTTSRQIILFGNDWLFSEIKMSQLSEEQCEIKLEWHRAHVSYLEQCITQHRIAKAHKLAQVRIPAAQRVEKKAKERKEKSLELLAASLKGMKSEDLAALMMRLQENVGKK